MNKSSLHVHMIDSPIFRHRYGNEGEHEFDECDRRIELSVAGHIGLRISARDQKRLKASRASCKSLLSLSMNLERKGQTPGGGRPGFHVPFLVSVENSSLIALSHSDRSGIATASRTDGSSLVVIESGDAAPL